MKTVNVEKANMIQMIKGEYERQGLHVVRVSPSETGYCVEVAQPIKE